jgi:inosine-uridine nucleoside N-ribohydrolase
VHYWIDTDPGLDDALAILLAVREIGASLVGLSSVHGNGEEPLMAHNLLRVLATYERIGLVPTDWSPAIARGARQPLAGGAPERGEAYHGEACLGGLPWSAGPGWSSRVRSASAAVAIVETARQVADLHLVCIGPLTNLALALHLEPELTRLVAGVTVMGGSLRSGGNETLAAEFNFLADPEAASVVLEAGFRVLALVPLDVCDEARLSTHDLARLDALGTDASRTARDLLRHFERRAPPDRGVPFYDPTAWLLTTHPQLAHWETIYVAVDTGSSLARGASLPDFRNRAGRSPNVRAATRLLDRDQFVERFFALLG